MRRGERRRRRRRREMENYDWEKNVEKSFASSERRALERLKLIL